MMMKEINKNESCPCKSGKQYKDCCFKKAYLNIFKDEGLEYYDEKFMIKYIMANDKNFKRFFRENRNTIDLELLWFKSDNLCSSMSYGVPIIKNYGQVAIIGNKNYAPIEIEKSLEVAHELQHIICCQEGYKFVRFKEGCGTETSTYPKAISDMINDPIVNNRIMKYNFNLYDYYKKADNIQMRSIGIYPIEKVLHENLIFITTLYVKKTLDLRNIYPDIKDEDVEFNKWIKKYYPEVIPISKQILKLVEVIGYNTPEKTESIFGKVISLLGLDDVLIIG